MSPPRICCIFFCTVSRRGGNALAGKTKLRPGNEAPDIYTVDANGVQLGLPDYRGMRSVVLVFLRYVGCPICRLALQDLKKNYAKFEEKDAEVVVFVQSPLESIEKAGGAAQFPFRLVADPEGEYYELYGVGSGKLGVSCASMLAPKTVARAVKATLKGHMQGKKEGNQWQLPGDFIVGRNGILKLARIGKNMGDNLTAKELLAYL
ncbi:MAG: peroxiredoxin-like family protein [bacterium]